MHQRIKKYIKKYNSLTASQAYMATKNQAVEKEKIATEILVRIEAGVKQLTQGISTILQPYYIIFGKEIYSKTLKHTSETLANEICILKAKWSARGLSSEVLESIIKLLTPSVECLAYLPMDARVIWPDTIASIPANWTRDTDFDDEFLQGVLNDDRTTGGGSHNHGQTHTHTGIQHRHTFVGSFESPADASSFAFGAFAVSQKNHSHLVATGNYATITYQNNSNPLSSTEAKPPYVRAIVIKPDIPQAIPNNGFCLTNNSSAPTGFSITGSGGTTDYDAKYILGALVGTDGGATGGSTTHNHTIANHSHQDDQHRHDYKLCGNSNLSARVSPNANPVRPRAHHNVRQDYNTLSDVSSTNINLIAKTWEPEYYKLLGIQNTSGGSILPSGVIVPFIGTIASIPSGWSHVAALGTRQVKITKTPAEIGDTGGANNHTHEIPVHGHIHIANHNHTTTETDFTEDEATAGGFVSASSITKSHSHTWTVNSITPTMNNKVAFDSSSTDGRDDYRKVIFIKYNG